jgi:hypothetical protein
MSFETKAFGAFVRQLAKAKVQQALPLEAFVRQHEDTVREVRREIHKGIASGLLSVERADELQRLIDVLMVWHRTHGFVETHLDGNDWLSLGNGGHMRRKHLDENYEHRMTPKFGTIEQELTKENTNEEES